MKKLLLLAVFTTLFMSTSAFAACDTQASNLAFQAAVQKAVTEDPSKLATIQEDINMLQSILADTKKTDDEICKAFDDITAKLK